jgi:hypothetical protein
MKIGYGEIEKQKEMKIIHKFMEKFKERDDFEAIREEMERMSVKSIREAIEFDSMGKEKELNPGIIYYAHIYRVGIVGWLIEINFYHIKWQQPSSTDRFVMMVNKRFIFRDFFGNIKILQPVEDYLEECQGDKND